MLIHRFCDGHNEALFDLFPNLVMECYAIAMYYIKHKENAEDVVSDALEKILNMTPHKRHQKFVKEQIDLHAFIRIVVKNAALDCCKKKKRRSELLKLFWTYDDTFNDEALLNEDWKTVFKTLNPMEEIVLDMHIQGFSNDEIATQNNIAYKTVANLLSAARKKIRQYWLSL